MTNEVSVFQFNQSQQVRVIVRDGEPWFCAADVCRVLDIKNGKHLVKSRLDADGVVQNYLIDSMGRRQQNNMINEPNLYRLIFRSDKKEAKQFQDWVFNEVLPQIRKTGSYQGDMPSLEPISHAQRMALKREVNKLDSGWVFKHEDIGFGFYNLVRVKYNLHHIDELPAIHFDSVMAMVKEVSARHEQMIDVFNDIRRYLLNEFILGNSIWTPTVKKRFKQQIGKSLPPRPDWVKLNNQLTH